MADGGLFEGPIVADYPNRLAAPAPQQTPVARRPLLLLGLLVLCLLPRSFLAWRAGAICPDATLYIALARALEAGDFRAGLREMGWNTYPALLAALHRAGLDWETAGKWWGVLASSLVVLPMFGYLRRQFDDRVATAGCLLYGVHANVIEWTPEVLRDPTFWFFFLLAMYLLWRAVIEIRWGLFVAAGVAAALAVLTRFEGLFLVIPLGVWAAARWRSLQCGRGKLAAGVGVVLAVCPLLLLSLNLLAFRGESWMLLRLKPLEVAWAWLAGSFAPSGPASVPSASVTPPAAPAPSNEPADPMRDMRSAPVSPPAAPAPAPSAAIAAPAVPALAPSAPSAAPPQDPGWLVTLPPRLGPRQLIWAYLNELERGLTVVFGLPMLVGLWRGRRLLARGDHLPAGLLSLVVLGAMWIHLWFSETRCFRYPITVVLVTSGFAGLGLLAVSSGLKRLALRRGLAPRWGHVLMALPLVLIAAVGLADALTKNYQRRVQGAELGRWLAARGDVRRVLISPDSPLRVVAHYAAADCVAFPEYTTAEGLRQIVQTLQPDAILLSPCQLRPERLAEVLQRVEPLGYGLARQPPGTDCAWVVARQVCPPCPAEYVARQPR